jgi:arginine repressor
MEHTHHCKDLYIQLWHDHHQTNQSTISTTNIKHIQSTILATTINYNQSTISASTIKHNQSTISASTIEHNQSTISVDITILNITMSVPSPHKAYTKSVPSPHEDQPAYIAQEMHAPHGAQHASCSGTGMLCWSLLFMLIPLPDCAHERTSVTTAVQVQRRL